MSPDSGEFSKEDYRRVPPFYIIINRGGLSMFLALLSTPSLAASLYTRIIWQKKQRHIKKKQRNQRRLQRSNFLEKNWRKEKTPESFAFWRFVEGLFSPFLYNSRTALPLLSMLQYFIEVKEAEDAGDKA